MVVSSVSGSVFMLSSLYNPDNSYAFDFGVRFRSASSFSAVAILNVPYRYASGCSLVRPRIRLEIASPN
jgi:hypothetical protein